MEKKYPSVGLANAPAEGYLGDCFKLDLLTNSLPRIILPVYFLILLNIELVKVDT